MRGKIGVKCVICRQGVTNTGTVTVTLQRNVTTVIIKNVPADVCENCGEYYLTEELTEELLMKAKLAAENNAEVEILRYAA